METNELYLKTLFCCSACDGEIAPEEISLVKKISRNETIFSGINVECIINQYVEQINKLGKVFLKEYLNNIADATLSDEEQIKLFELAIKMIEADNKIEYSEVKFIKKIRSNLSISDNIILNALPDSEEYLLPDIISDEKEDNWSDIAFSPIKITPD